MIWIIFKNRFQIIILLYLSNRNPSSSNFSTSTSSSSSTCSSTLSCSLTSSCSSTSVTCLTSWTPFPRPPKTPQPPHPPRPPHPPPWNHTSRPPSPPTPYPGLWAHCYAGPIWKMIYYIAEDQANCDLILVLSRQNILVIAVQGLLAGQICFCTQL